MLIAIGKNIFLSRMLYQINMAKKYYVYGKKKHHLMIIQLKKSVRVKHIFKLDEHKLTFLMPLGFSLCAA